MVGLFRTVIRFGRRSLAETGFLQVDFPLNAARGLFREFALIPQLDFQPTRQVSEPGGIDGFIGDGRINLAPEQVVNLFYSFNVLSSVWLTADYQHISNPAFNADRGPVNVYGARIHAEF